MSDSVRSLAARAVALSIASTVLPSLLFAAEATREIEDELPEVIVTAQFIEQNLQDTPIAITAVNAEMLEARGQTDIAQVAAQSPNVVLRQQPQNSGVGLIAFIRGIGQTDFNYALEPGVGIYVDDVYIPTLSSSLLDLMDLDRVEVLRGPQGTLAGKNSIGGAIKLFSSKPDGTGRGSLQATYGSYNRIDVRGFSDFAINDKLFARISGVSKNRNGYVTLLDYGMTHPGSNVGSNNNAGKGGKLGTLGGQNFAAGRFSVRWMPNEEVELNVSADITNETSDSGAEVLLYANNPAVTPNGQPWLRGLNGNAIPADCRFVPNHGYHGSFANASCDTLAPALGYNPKYISYANFLDAQEPTSQSPYKPYAAIPGNKFNSWGVQYNLTAALGDSMELTWIGSLREYDSTWGMDQDSTPVPIAQLNQSLQHKAWSQELRLNGEIGDGFFQYTFGGFYFDQDGSLQARVDLSYAGIDFIHGPDTTPSKSSAIFFNGTLNPTDAWSVTGGLRYSDDEKTYTYFRSNPDGTVPGPGPCPFFLGAPTAGPTGIGNPPNCLLLGLYNVSDSFKGTRWDWRLVTDYRFSDQFLGYASVATGYKGGGVNPRPFFGPSSPNNQLKAFKPETLTTFELGAKSDLFNRRLRLNGAVFLNKYEDIILTLLECPTAPCLQPNNVGKADVKGAELEMTVYPGHGLLIDASLSYLDFQYKNLSNVAVTLDMVTPYTPEWTWSAGIQHDWNMDKGTFSTRVDGSFQSKMYTAAINNPTSYLPGRFLANARLSYTTMEKDWQVSLEVQNLLNKYYMHNVSDIVSSLGVWTGNPGLPRTYAMTIKRNFQ
jgi:iron complex outermembrane recepter protein